MLIFLDTQTTGLQHEDKICSIALVVIDDTKIYEYYDLVNDGKKITSLASSINHITNEMIEKKTKLVETKIYKFLNTNNLKTTTIIGHNIKFDLEKLSQYGFHFIGNIIDTLRVTKHLIPECEIFSLQFLRYELHLYKQKHDNLNPYNSLSRARSINLLYSYLLDIAPKEKMIELSLKNVLIQKFEFGKYKGRYIEEISMCDRTYLQWILVNLTDIDDDLRYSISYYLD